MILAFKVLGKLRWTSSSHGVSRRGCVNVPITTSHCFLSLRKERAACYTNVFLLLLCRSHTTSWRFLLFERDWYDWYALSGFYWKYCSILRDKGLLQNYMDIFISEEIWEKRLATLRGFGIIEITLLNWMTCKTWKNTWNERTFTGFHTLWLTTTVTAKNSFDCQKLSKGLRKVLGCNIRIILNFSRRFQ